MTCLGEDMGIIVTFWGNVVSAFGVMLSSGSTFVVVRGCLGSCFGVLVTDSCSLLVMILVFGFDGCWLLWGKIGTKWLGVQEGRRQGPSLLQSTVIVSLFWFSFVLKIYSGNPVFCLCLH